jgi:hypothetical protein
MKTELLLGLLMNVSSVSAFFATLAGLALIVFTVFFITGKSDKSAEGALLIGKKGLKITLPIFVITLSLGLIPTVDQMFKIRIGLLKLELTNKENVQVGVDEIGKIAKKLECKYLGCEEKKKEKSNE